jgi:hypothetical protein
MAQPQGDTTHDWKQDLAKARTELRGMADELRLKIHLAGMEAKDAWNKLEPKLLDFEKRAENAAQATAHELREVGKDLKQRIQKIRESV